MITGVEIDLVVKDSLAALKQYQAIFDLEVIEQTNFPVGLNEVVFTIYGTRFHLLDENPEYQLLAPTPDNPQSIWFNVVVPNINDTFLKAIDAGATPIQEVTEMKEMGISNAIFLDSFNYTWMLHQIHQEVSFEEREEMFKEEFDL